MMERYLGVVACLAAFAGAGCLFASWMKRRRSNGTGKIRWLVPSGWGLLAASPVIWSRASGSDFGVTFAFLAIALAAWCAVIANAKFSPARGQPVPDGRRLTFNRQGVAKHILMFMASVPLAGVASALFSVTVSTLLPMSRVNELVLGALTVPVVWGAAAYWLCASPGLEKPVAFLVITGALSGLFLYA